MKVRNAKGTSIWKNPSCKCHTWIEHWEKNSNIRIPVKCPACGSVVKDKSDWDGAHVKKVSSRDERYYIVPLCSSCNPKDDLEFEVDQKYLVLANANDCNNL